MAQETSSGAVSGAAQGAAAGTAIMPGWGTLIGAVIGGLIGAFGGDKRRQQRRYSRLAADTRRRQQQMQLAVQRRDVVRQFRVARAQAAAAGESDVGTSSSAVQGAVASFSAQGNANLDYFDNQVLLDNLYQTYAKKAGKAAEDAGTFEAILGASGSIAQIGANMRGFSKSEKPAGQGSPTTPVGAYSTLQPNQGTATQTQSNVVTIPYAFPQVQVLGEYP